QRGGDLGQQRSAGLGELDAGVEAIDQAAAEVRLEPAHAVADRALCQAQLSCCAREAQVARHRFERDQLGKRRQGAHAPILPARRMTRIHAPRRIRHLPAHGALPTLRAVNTDTSDPPPAAASTERCLFLTVNGQSAAHTVPAHTTLAQLLRERLHLTGTKVACDQAACGACTVLLDGQAVFACHTLAAQCDGADVRTIEGLAAADGTLHPLQQAFIDHDALQCGFCTPGMLMALHAALQGARERAEVPDRDALAHAIAGNLCRCGAYPHILEA